MNAKILFFFIYCSNLSYTMESSKSIIEKPVYESTIIKNIANRLDTPQPQFIDAFCVPQPTKQLNDEKAAVVLSSIITSLENPDRYWKEQIELCHQRRIQQGNKRIAEYIWGKDHNPADKEKIKIPIQPIPSFRAGKALKKMAKQSDSEK